MLEECDRISQVEIGRGVVNDLSGDRIVSFFDLWGYIASGDLKWIGAGENKTSITITHNKRQ